MYEQVNPNQDLLTYRSSIIESLLRDMAFAIHQTLDKPDEQNVHDLRRLCLRLRYALRLFGRTLPPRPARKTLRRLRELQNQLAGARSCDVAVATLAQPGIAAAVSKPETRKVTTTLAGERKRSLRPLRLRLRKMQRGDAIGRWRRRLLAVA